MSLGWASHQTGPHDQVEGKSDRPAKVRRSAHEAYVWWTGVLTAIKLKVCATDRHCMGERKSLWFCHTSDTVRFDAEKERAPAGTTKRSDPAWGTPKRTGD